MICLILMTLLKSILMGSFVKIIFFQIFFYEELGQKKTRQTKKNLNVGISFLRLFLISKIVLLPAII